MGIFGNKKPAEEIDIDSKIDALINDSEISKSGLFCSIVVDMSDFSEENVNLRIMDRMHENGWKVIGICFDPNDYIYEIFFMKE